MVKVQSKKMNNKSAKKGSGRGLTKGGPGKQNQLVRYREALDEGATKWLKLLSDPCNAPLAPACFPGVASGMMYRCRQYINLGADAVDGYLFFTPAGASSGPGYYPLQWSSVNTTGTSPITAYGFPIDALPAGAEVRCAAACLKLHYTGSELDRGGLVGTHITTDPPTRSGTPTGAAGTYATTQALFSTCNTVKRLGTTQHEVRWMPAIGDGNFIDATAPSRSYVGNAVGISFQGVPAGTITMELTAVYEVVPNAVSGLVNPIIAPTSRNSLNDVLRGVGDVARWATDPTNFRPVGQLLYGAARLTAKVAPSVAMLTM